MWLYNSPASLWSPVSASALVIVVVKGSIHVHVWAVAAWKLHSVALQRLTFYVNTAPITEVFIVLGKWLVIAEILKGVHV